MAEWKKVVVSGSSAELSNLNVDSAVTASAFKGDGSALTNISLGSLSGNISQSAQVFQDITGDVTIASNGTAAIGAGVIVNADVKSDAAIAYSKLNLTGAVVNDDLAGSIANNKLANDGITIAGNDTSLGGSITAATILDGTGTVSGSAQAVAALVNQDVALGTGDISATSASFAAVSASSFIGNGSGLTGLTFANINAAEENIEDIVNGLIVGGSNITATYDDAAGTLTLDADLTGDIEGITAGAGLTGGGTSGSPTVNVGAGSGITVNADDIQVDATVLRTTGGGVHSGSAQVVAALSNQDVNLGTGDLTATSASLNSVVLDVNGTDTLLFRDGGSDSVNIHAKSSVNFTSDMDSAALFKFGTGAAATIIDVENGQVGIGVTPSAGALDVKGQVSASRYNGSGAGLTSIPNSALDNSSVSLGGVTVALGASDATPAFNLADATGYLTSNLSGTITNAQLGGSISNDKLAGSIANDKLANSSITIAGAATSLGGSITQAAILAGSGVLSGSAGVADSSSFASTASLANGVIANSVALGTDTTGDFVSALGSGTGVTIGSNSGEASNPTIAVNYGSTANTAVQGNATATFTGTANEITVSNSSAQALGGGISVQIGLPDDVTIAGTGSVNGDLSVAGNLAVGGDLTYVNSTDLMIQDPFILLNSGSDGSTQGDSGIVFGGADGVINSGNLLFWDKSYNGNDGRLRIKNGFAHTSTGNVGSPDYSIAGVFEGSEADAATAQADHVGNIRVESDEIYIYV